MFEKLPTYIKLDAPIHLKKELDTILALQADIDTTDRAIHIARVAIQKVTVSEDTMATLDSLECTHDRLLTKVDALYALLNVSEKFPELEGIRLEFIRTLILALNLKINIRKLTIGSFFKWDKLDRAVGGAQQALGMHCMSSRVNYPESCMYRYETPSTDSQGHLKAAACLDECST